jgi:DNA modification methylase
MINYGTSVNTRITLQRDRRDRRVSGRTGRGDGVTARIICGDCLEVLKTLPAESVNCCVTSPPYWGLRDYGVDGQIGLEETPDAYVARLVEVFREVRRVLKDDGTLWLNLGDCYLDRNLLGIPWKAALALRADGWTLRADVIWHKPNPSPSSVLNRPVPSHEYVFLFATAPGYYYDTDAIRVPYAESSASRYKYAFGGAGAKAAQVTKNPAVGGDVPIMMQANPRGKNPGDVWSVRTAKFPEAHFATFPPDLIRPCIRAGCPAGGVVLDPFAGAGTTGLVALEEGRDFLGIELNPEYVGLIEKRLAPLTKAEREQKLAEKGQS